MDMHFLNHYRDVTQQLRGTYGSKKCGHCQEILSTAAFSKNKRRKDGLSNTCEYCHAEQCEQTRVKKRIWAEEEQHYEVPGGMHASKAQRLAALYEKQRAVFKKVSDEQLRDLPVYQEFMAAVPTWYSTAQTARGVGASKAQRFVLSNRAKHEAQIWHGD